ncbi:MAG: YhgE/Pip domain-containing protein [Limosilactobacillus sp.]|uniref:YhgE/Pip domain-containing protein n=1 Tax=Limosilactobacillus sp. TaxID=2773925 RepID=UPI00270CDDA0|nr:YhgE/Pip domain-containing protein [Limosilactobacillus sp.]
MGKMIKAELQNLFQNKTLLLSISVICLLPFLYSIFFLKSVWDPYGNTRDLPIAVVNKDVPVKYQGKKMEVGKETTNQLKRNHQMKWEIVSNETAQHGLTHRKYYAVITIPKNFSKNAATVMNKNPKQMQLQYTTNGSLNYIGEVMSQIGTKELNTKIRAQVTKAYATAMFKELGVLGKGMDQAADGSKQLSNGIVTLSDGVNRYVAGVDQVNNGVQTMKVSVAPLSAGAQQLVSGSQTLANGLSQYTGGVSQLASGLGLLQSNSGQLSSGTSQLATGLDTLSSNSGQLSTGAGQLAAGTSELNNQVSAMLPAMQNQMGTASQGIASDANELAKALQPLSQSAQQLEQLNQALTAINNGLSQIKSASAQENQLISAVASLQGVKTTDASSQAKLDAVVAAAQNAGKSGNLSDSIGQVQSNITALQTQITAAQNSASQNTANVAKAAQQLQTSLTNLQNSTNATMTSASSKLTAATNQLAAGASQLNSGVQQYTNGVNSAAAGAKTLNSGVSQYTAGVSQASSGVNQLMANSPALVSGASQLAGALTQLNAQVPSLVSGVNLLAAGTQQLADNSPALVSGITKLNDGAAQLADKLGKGAKQVNSIKPTQKTAKMFAEPSTLKHKDYSYVPNYGHALAPYVLSVALYTGVLVFNFIYPIRRPALEGQSAVAWWGSKVFIGAVTVTIMAIIEDVVMIAAGLTTDHIPSMLVTSICFGLAAVSIVMFLSMIFDNPGRFVAMVLLMLQLGGSGGTFPMEVTMKFYNVIHWFLPMTYSILGLRQSITGGIGEHYAMFCNLVLLGIAVVFNLLLLVGMIGIHRHTFSLNPELDRNQQFIDNAEKNGINSNN